MLGKVQRQQSGSSITCSECQFEHLLWTRPQLHLSTPLLSLEHDRLEWWTAVTFGLGGYLTRRILSTFSSLRKLLIIFVISALWEPRFL